MSENEKARAAIDARLEAMQAAWNAHDAKAYTAGLAEDVDYTNVFGITLHGRAAITASHEAIFAGMFSQSVTAFTDVRVRFVRNDVAAVEVRWEMTGARDPAGKEWPKRFGLMNMTAEQRDGEWWFSVFHNMDLPPPEKVREIGLALGQIKR